MNRAVFRAFDISTSDRSPLVREESQFKLCCKNKSRETSGKKKRVLLASRSMAAAMAGEKASFDALFAALADAMRAKDGWEARQEDPPAAYLHVSRRSWGVRAHAARSHPVGHSSTLVRTLSALPSRALKHARKHALSLRRARTRTHARTHACEYARTHAPTHPRTHPPTYIRARGIHRIRAKRSPHMRSRICPQRNIAKRFGFSIYACTHPPTRRMRTSTGST